MKFVKKQQVRCGSLKTVINTRLIQRRPSVVCLHYYFTAVLENNNESVETTEFDLQVWIDFLFYCYSTKHGMCKLTVDSHITRLIKNYTNRL